jgi:glucose-1-phosphate adenylyltransferase
MNRQEHFTMKTKAKGVIGGLTSDRVIAVILGGGRGTRLYPLTRERAKPAVPVGGRYRLVDIPLSNCINSGINKVFVVTQFNSHSLNRHVTDAYKFDVFSRGFVEVLAAEQTLERGDWFQGTADAVRQNMMHLRNTPSDHVLILSGDHLYRMDYRPFLARHIDAGADISVATIPVDAESAKSFGIMKVDSTGRITEFTEKPQSGDQLDLLRSPGDLLESYGFDGSHGREYLASMGVYLIKWKVLEEILDTRREWVDFGKHVIPLSLKDRPTYSYLFDGYWEDIGTVRSFYEVSMRLCQPNPPFEFYNTVSPVYSRPRYLPGCRVRGAVITDCIVCEGSSIFRAHLSNSIIGIRAVIQKDVDIAESILMGADYFEQEPPEGLPGIGIGEGTRISRAIVDKNARIGKNCVIKGSESLANVTEKDYSIVDGVVIILKGAVIPDGTRIGDV